MFVLIFHQRGDVQYSGHGSPRQQLLPIMHFYCHVINQPLDGSRAAAKWLPNRFSCHHSIKSIFAREAKNINGRDFFFFKIFKTH